MNSSDTIAKELNKLNVKKNSFKSTKLPVKSNTTAVAQKPQQKSSYFISKSPGSSKKDNDHNKQLPSPKEIYSNINDSQRLKDKTQSSPQILNMIDRFRFSKPTPSDEREKQAFWWNNCSPDDSGDEISNIKYFDVKESNGNFIKNLEDLDKKARNLIDKSEFTLSEKMISSEGLGSTSSTITSDASSRIVEEVPFKPEFVKYLETKNQNEMDITKLNPNEDILYKWRLRRKLEGTKAINAQQQNSIISDNIFHSKAPLYTLQTRSEQIPLVSTSVIPTITTTPMQHLDLLLQPTVNLPIENLSNMTKTTATPVLASLVTTNQPYSSPIQSQLPLKNDLTAHAKSTSTPVKTTLKKTITDCGVQTSIDNIQNLIHEKPTRDENKTKSRIIKGDNAKINFEQKFKSRKSSKSPTYRSTSTILFDKTMSSIQKSNISDLTQISSIYEANSNSKNNENESSIQFIDSLNKKQNLFKNNQKTEDRTNRCDEIMPYNKKNVHKFINNEKINKQRIICSNIVFDASFYECDELLNILFRKLFFINQN